MRILYLSCHSILEYDEVSLLGELGHYVFSPGCYIDPAVSGDGMRPGLANIQYDPEDLAAWHALCAQYPGQDAKDHLTRKFVDRFDAVVVMHLPKWIAGNWPAMRHKPVVWRTIGQSIQPVEMGLARYRQDGLKVVRYSPRERTIPGYLGEDALIRFYKDPEEFGGWTGHEKAVITFNQALPDRVRQCNYDFWKQVTSGFPTKLYGPGNEAAGSANQGKVSFDELKAAMRDHRVYLYVGTHPASYTLNFIEAWMTGIPIVAVGPKLGNADYFPGHDLYEVPDLIQEGISGFTCDDVVEAQGIIRHLMENDDLAAAVSRAGRKRAVELFSKDAAKAGWRNFLETL